MQHHPNIRHRSPTCILTLSLSHITLPILTLLILTPPYAHLFCTSLMVIFSKFDDLLWMHVDYIHVVMHIAMLKWCIRCYILCGLT